MTTYTLLALGSNVGVREAHLAHALQRLSSEMQIRAVSSVWETDPVGFTEQGKFLNMVVDAATDGTPDEVLALVREIELERGRVRSFRNAPRSLDIDVLLYGDREVREEGLTIPHPRMRDRPFVLVPLLELDPELEDPVTGMPFRRDLERLVGGSYGGVREVGERLGMRRVMDGEELLDEPVE